MLPHPASWFESHKPSLACHVDMVLTRALVIVLASGCCSDDYDPGEATRQPALDAAFHQEPRWLGGDGAYTIDLGDDQTLWLFGDSFIATSPNLTRNESTMVRNSIAVMTGRDLATASLSFTWRDGAPPSAFFPAEADHWFWPSDGTRIPGGPLLVFLSELAPSAEGLGFAGAGFRAVRIADPSAPPVSWVLEPTTVHAPAFAPRSNVACSAVDGDHLVAVVTDEAAHDGRLARWPLAAIAAGEDLSEPEWWTGTIWLRESALTKSPKVMFPGIATECSLENTYDGDWHLVWSSGFGATTIAMRTGYTLTGDWFSTADIFTPGESAAPNAFVYAAKAHPMLRGPNGGMLITYADNSFTFADLFDPAKASTLYWPHVVEMLLSYALC
jgi:hypothetical protein